MNTYAVGDIHGQFFKLEKLMNKLFIKEGDTIVFLGDYIDRGEMVYEVVEFLIEFNKKYNCIFLMGNHEDMFIDYLSGINEKQFLWNKGMDTIKSYEEHGYSIGDPNHSERLLPKSHMEFFINLKPYYETEYYIFVHAGIMPSRPMERQDRDTLLWDRDFHYKYSETYKGPKTIIYGHTPGKLIKKDKFAICIDTGGCFVDYGNLTSVRLPEKVFIQQGPTIEDLGD